MRLFLLTALTMIAFAANSVLNRMAVGGGQIGPGEFAVLRVLSGAAMLSLLAVVRHRPLPLWSRRRIVGAGALAIYMVGFSMAYLRLDAGLGALILFGVVQLGMFGFAALTGAMPTLRQCAGAAVAFAGLALALWPQGGLRADVPSVLLMVAAGAGWAAYTLAGRAEPDALAGTAANFLWCLPATALAIGIGGPLWGGGATGVALAVLSGAVTSGLGYALWYALVPQLGPARAATVQLSVPVIAIGAGVLLLSEPASGRLILGAALVLGGIFLILRQPPG